MEKTVVDLYIDGSCINNGNYNTIKKQSDKAYGGWAFIAIVDNEIVYQEAGGDDTENVTNNRMEITALIKAFNWILKQKSEDTQYANSKFVIYSDSSYVIMSTLFYIKKWVRNNFMKSPIPGSEPMEVKNRDLWEEVYRLFYKELLEQRNIEITIKKVKAHNTSVYNNEADKLCRDAAIKHHRKNMEEGNTTSAEDGKEVKLDKSSVFEEDDIEF